MPEKIEFKISSRTPLFTGGIDGKCERLHETGIIGSMRWWYEAIVRGLGGFACDPILHECPDKKGHYCDACAVFGTTGLKRAFRLDLSPINDEKGKRLALKVVDNQTHKGWYLNRGIFASTEFPGDLIFPTRSLSSCNINKQNLQQMLLLVLYLAVECGGMGAKTQQGYGIIGIEQIGCELDIEKALYGFNKLFERSNRLFINGDGLPSLNEFFFVRVSFTMKNNVDIPNFIASRVYKPNSHDSELKYYADKKVIPLAPIIRYQLRGLIRNKWDHKNGGKVLRHKLMGHIDGNISKSKSLINVSHAYEVDQDKFEFRIWGWIPQSLSGEITRNEVMGVLKEWMGKSDEAGKGLLWEKCQLETIINDVNWMEKKDETIEKFLKRLLPIAKEVKK